MKKEINLMVLLTIVIFGNIFGQYDPMVKENKFWLYNSFYSNDIPNLASVHLINFDGDTLISSMSYKKVWRQELSGTHPCPPGQEPCFVVDYPYNIVSKLLVGYIRENVEEKKVYYKSEDDTYCNQEEYLLFDYSLAVNDALDECKKSALGGQSSFGIIDSISNQQIFDSTRKVLHTFGYVTYIGLPIEGKVNIVESIGFEKFGLFHEINNLNELYDYCEGSLSDCNIISNTKEDVDNYAIKIFPNPSSGKIILSTNLPIASTEIYSSNGNKIDLDIRGNTFDMHNLVNGLYIIKITTNDGRVFVRKVIKRGL